MPTPMHVGDNRWRIRWFAFDETGRSVRRSKTFEATSLRAATREAARIIEADGGKAARARTLNEAVAAYLERDLRQRVGRAHWENQVAAARRHVYPDPIGRARLGDIGPLDIEAWYARLTAKGLKPQTVRNTAVVVRGAYQAMARWGWWTAPSPVPAARLPKRNAVKRNPPAKADIAIMLLRAAEIGADFELVLRLALATGCRRGELAGLTWGQIHWTKAQLEVDRAVSITASGVRLMKGTKNGMVRVVDIDDATLAALDAWSRRPELRADATDPDRFLFSDDHGFTPQNPQRWTAGFRELRRLCGIPDTVKLHSCRHWVASILLSNGVDPATVANQLGHRQISTTLNTYSHMLPGKGREIAAMLGDQLDG